MKTYIYFVRHALSPFSLDNERSRGLSKQGMSDSERVAEILFYEGIDVIVSSTYVRAIETVKPLAVAMKKDIVEYDELRERPIASLKYEISEDQLLEGIKRSFEDIDFCMEDGETTRQAQERSIPIIERLLKEYKGKKICIGTHGNIMTIILNYYDSKFGYDFWIQTSKPDIYKLVFDGMELKEVKRLWKFSKLEEGNDIT